MGIQTSIRLEIAPAASKLWNAIVVGYTTLGNPISNRARMILLQNFTNGDLWISKNGVDDHIPLGSRSFMYLISCQINRHKACPFMFQKEHNSMSNGLKLLVPLLVVFT